MTIKAVIWDIGGVLVRTEDRTPREKLAAELGVTADHLAELVFEGEQGRRAQRGELTQNQIWNYVRQQLNLAPGECPDLRERFFAGDRLDLDLVEFTRALRPRYKTGIISNAWRELPALLERWQIADAFDVVIGSGDEGVMKPDPQIYHLALQRLQVEPQAAVFVDDFSQNVQAARQLGLHAIHFQNREQALRELQTLLNLQA